MNKKTATICLFLSAFNTAHASWLSEILGPELDLNRGTLVIKPPNLSAIPEMLQNLPKDVGQAMLNPVAPVLATAIRFSRGQAINAGVQTIPPNVRSELTPYFPPAILDKVRWRQADGVTLQGALKNWFNQEGAVTLDEVIAFSDPRLANDVALWAHELTHVLQYAQLGVETFAFHYTFNFQAMEAQARDNSSRIVASISATRNGQPRSWGYEGQVAQFSSKPTWSQMHEGGKRAIDPAQCIWVDAMQNMTGNNCPIPITVTNLVVQRYDNGVTVPMICAEPTCRYPVGARGPLISPPWGRVVGVTAAY